MSSQSFMNNSIKAFVIALLIVIISSESEVLFKSGWYKDGEKGERHLIADVLHIDSRTVADTGYLRVRAKITVLHKGSVRNLLNVKTLKLISCEISSIEQGSFQNLPNLATLALYDNDIELIDKGVFNHLAVIRLYLHRNNIFTINSEAFDDMPKLQLLKLNSNKLTVIDGEWFKNTPRLTDLYLRRNEIGQIQSGAFKNLGARRNSSGTGYAKIFLSKNIISSVHPSAFEGLQGLDQLWLDRNELEELHEGVFARMEYLGVLFLSKNSFSGLPKKLLSKFNIDLMTLDLAGNKNVSCLDYDIVSKVKITNLEKIPGIDCRCVELLCDRLVENGEDNEITTDCYKRRY